MKKTAKKLSRTDILTYVSDRLADVIVYEQIGSTNTEARRMLAEGKPTPFLLAAMSQTAGRGRRGNTFFSPESGLYMTLALKPDEYKSAIARTTIAAAVSLYEAILETTGIVCGIKWVNDLYFEQKKIAGILCEAPRGTSGQPLGILIGIGVNVAQKEFPDELKEKAGSLNRPDLDRNLLASVLTKRLLYWCSHLNDPALIASYKAHSILLGHTVSFQQNSKTITGTAEDITDSGSLLVRTADQLFELNSGEISLLSW